MGTVAQVPPPAWTEVARGVGRARPRDPVAAGRGSGGAGPTGTDRNCGQHRANDTSAGVPARGYELSHRPFRTVLNVAAKVTAKEDSVASVAGPGSTSTS